MKLLFTEDLLKEGLTELFYKTIIKQYFNELSLYHKKEYNDMERLLHTPDGVRDIYNDECEKKLKLQNRLRGVLKGYGYRDIETPTFEFFDVFSKSVGTTPSKDLYKFFDREGNTLVLRPDITPSIARAVSKYFSEEENEIRLCYQGNTFINNSSYQGRLKESTHLGAELIGADTAQADAEIISMVVDCLKAAGLEEFQISIGQLDYFKSILKDLDLSEEEELELKDFISNRNIFGVEGILDRLNIQGKAREALLAMPELYGSVEVLDQAMAYAVNSAVVQAVERLREIYRILEYYGITGYISFDFSMLSRYSYYTGIFFRGYTFGSGDAVVKGGRYDNLLMHFGKDAPSIGFVAVIDELMSALAHQKVRPEPLEEILRLSYDRQEEKRTVQLAGVMRKKGKRVALHYQTEEISDEERARLKQYYQEYQILG